MGLASPSGPGKSHHCQLAEPLLLLQWSVSEGACECPLPPAPLKEMGKEILGQTPPLADGE